jgi:membrane protease YdiL (CAAX protease family)
VISSDLMHRDFALILLFLAVAVPLLGRRRIRQLMQIPATTKRDRLRLYASTIAFQWIMVAVILWRTGAHGISPARLGVAIPSPVLTTIVTFVLALLVLTNQFVSLRALAANPEKAQGILPQLALKIFPQDSSERVVFFAVVVTVSVCEELIYRGFVQRVFQDWSGALIAVGIVGSALMFSVAHLYQGRRGVITTCVVGLLLAAVREWTGSLLAPLVAHFIADITVGLLAPSRLRAALTTPAATAATDAVAER